MAERTPPQAPSTLQLVHGMAIGLALALIGTPSDYRNLVLAGARQNVLWAITVPKAV
jgi:hypothetical protein